MVTAEFKTAILAYFKEVSNFPNFLHIWMADHAN